MRGSWKGGTNGNEKGGKKIPYALYSVRRQTDVELPIAGDVLVVAVLTSGGHRFTTVTIWPILMRLSWYIFFLPFMSLTSLLSQTALSRWRRTDNRFFLPFDVPYLCLRWKGVYWPRRERKRVMHPVLSCSAFRLLLFSLLSLAIHYLSWKDLVGNGILWIIFSFSCPKHVWR